MYPGSCRMNHTGKPHKNAKLFITGSQPDSVANGVDTSIFQV